MTDKITQELVAELRECQDLYERTGYSQYFDKMHDRLFCDGALDSLLDIADSHNRLEQENAALKDAVLGRDKELYRLRGADGDCDLSNLMLAFACWVEQRHSTDVEGQFLTYRAEELFATDMPALFRAHNELLEKIEQLNRLEQENARLRAEVTQSHAPSECAACARELGPAASCVCAVCLSKLRPHVGQSKFDASSG